MSVATRCVADRLAEGFVGQEDRFDNWVTSDMTIREELISVVGREDLVVSVEDTYGHRNTMIHNDTDIDMEILP